MPPLRGKTPLDELEREVLGCLFYCCFDHRLSEEHFGHDGRALAFIGVEWMRRTGWLSRPSADDDIVWHILAARWNAEFLAHILTSLSIWPAGVRAQHELVIETVRAGELDTGRIGESHIDSFHDTVTTLIREADVEREIVRMSSAIEELQRRREVCA